MNPSQGQRGNVVGVSHPRRVVPARQHADCLPATQVGLEPAGEGLGERVETVAIDRQVQWACLPMTLVAALAIAPVGSVHSPP